MQTTAAPRNWVLDAIKMPPFSLSILAPPDSDAKRPDRGVIEQVEIEVQVIWIKERLRRERLFQNGVCKSQEHDRRPAATCTTHDFANQQGAPSIHRSENQQRRKHG